MTAPLWGTATAPYHHRCITATVCHHYVVTVPAVTPTVTRCYTRQADESKRKFALLQSDHLAVLNAYAQYEGAHGEARYAFARERFLGIKTLEVPTQ